MTYLSCRPPDGTPDTLISLGAMTFEQSWSVTQHTQRDD